MIRRPPRSTRTDPLFPYTTLFRSSLSVLRRIGIGDDQHQRLASRLADADPRAFIKPRRHARFQILLCVVRPDDAGARDSSEEHTSELQSLMRISYAVFCLKNNIITNNQKKMNTNNTHNNTNI